jgi:hypothetical protein
MQYATHLQYITAYPGAYGMYPLIPAVGERFAKMDVFSQKCQGMPITEPRLHKRT